jgi:hypothetical protein
VTSQKKMVVVAFLGGLAGQALRRELGAVPPLSYLPPLDSSGPINLDMLGYWARYWASAPIIFAVIAIAATARKAGLRSSIVNGLGTVAAAIGITALLGGAQIAIAAIYPKINLPLTDASSDRDSFLRGFKSTCTMRMQANPEYNGLPAEAIDAFCSCAGNSAADAVTRVEIAYMEQHKAVAASFTEKVKTAYQKCAALTLGPQ